MVEVNQQENQNWLDYYGSSVNSEWMIPKILEMKHKAPELLEHSLYYGSWRLHYQFTYI